MYGLLNRVWRPLALACFLLLLGGCASISEHTHAYLGSPAYAPSDPARVQILSSEPTQPKERLGEVILMVDGRPKRERVEQRLRKAAAKLGADAVFIVQDKLHVYPYVYYDWWWGPMGVYESARRRVVAVAVKFK